MIRRTTNLRKVFDVQKQVDQTREALFAIDSRDLRSGPLLEMYTELLELRARVEAAEMATRRRP